MTISSVSSTSISLELATFRSQALGSLFNANAANDRDALWAAVSRQSGLGDANSAESDPLSMPAAAGGIKGLSPSGRNLALFNPESAYKMMSVIKGNDASYKAQFSELSQMKAAVAQMQEAGQTLGGIDASASNQSIAARLQNFVARYNDWVERFGPDMQAGGVLADTQAAQVSRHELEQSVENVFNGAKDGVHGLADLGVTIDPRSGLASLDGARLDALLNGNRSGAVDTLQEFSANFTKSASLLTSDGNIVPNRLDNLGKVINYFAEHQADLQSEFGTGDAARPKGLLAQALAAYNQRYGV